MVARRRLCEKAGYKYTFPSDPKAGALRRYDLAHEGVGINEQNIANMISQPKESYRVFASITITDSDSESSEKRVVDHVLCKVFVPKRTTDRASLHFLPTDEQEKLLQAAHLVGVRADLTQPNGDVNVISSRETLITSHKRTAWGPQLIEHILIGDVWDLRIETIRPESTFHEAAHTEGCFQLSSNQLLSNVWERSFSYTGDVQIGKLEPLRLSLANGLPISFTVHSRYSDTASGDTVMFDENVAAFDVPEDTLGKTTIADSVEHLEDALRLVSFVGEYPCVCLGWQAVDSRSVTEFYRRRSIPPGKPPSVHEALIDYADFEDFIPSAYKEFVEVKPNAALRRALDYVVPDEADSLESSYIMLYAAVETLVLFFRRRAGLEFVFSDESEWKRLCAALRKWLKAYPVLSDKKGKRSLIYEKLSELQRPSFSSAFRRFCDHYGVDLGDLWPMVGGGQADSLSTIRNKLVHGEVYRAEHYQALMGAREHLRWSIYRMIFGMLRWPIDRTKISPKRIARSPIHRTLEQDLRQISQ